MWISGHAAIHPISIISEKDLNIYVGENTYLLGSVMNSKNGKLSLDTGNLYFDNLHDRDVYKRIEAHVNTAGISSGAVGNQAIGTILKNSDAWGSYYYKNKKGISYATIGEGEIKVRNNPSLQLTALNRDVNNLQITTKDKEINIEIPGINLYKLKEGIKNATNIYRAATQADDILRDNGKEVNSYTLDVVRDGIMMGKTSGEIAAYINSPKFEKSVISREIVANKQGKYSQEYIAKTIYYVSNLEKAQINYKTGEVEVETNCDENGPAPCSIPISKLKNLTAEDIERFASASLDYLKENPESLEAKSRAGDGLTCLFTWSIAQKDTRALKSIVNKYSYKDVSQIFASYGGSAGLALTMSYASEAVKNKDVVGLTNIYLNFRNGINGSRMLKDKEQIIVLGHLESLIADVAKYHSEKESGNNLDEGYAKIEAITEKYYLQFLHEASPSNIGKDLKELSLVAAGEVAGAAFMASKAGIWLSETLSKAGGSLASSVAKIFGKSTDDVVKGMDEAELGINAIRTDINSGKTLVIGKGSDLSKGSLKADEYIFQNRMPNLGSAKNNWKQNSGLLREAMKQNKPIKDITAFNGSARINPLSSHRNSFLGMERNLLKNHGWSYNNQTGYWMPPIR